MKSFSPTSYFLLPTSEQGFTLIELMVAISIMVILSTIMLVNLAGQRAARDVQIAENQLVSNIRSIQSSTLSSRLLSNRAEVQYYLLKIDLSEPTQYTIQAIYNVGTDPQAEDVQTVTLPPNIRFASAQTQSDIYPVKITGRPASPGEQDLSDSSNPPGCALIAFEAPFGDVLFNDGCYPNSFPSVPYTLCESSNSNSPCQPDDYYKFLDFISNTACDGGNPPNPPVCTVSTDDNMTITLTDDSQTVTRTITINAITGSITAD